MNSENAQAELEKSLINKQDFKPLKVIFGQKIHNSKR